MVACEFALNQTWYVTFESESDAMNAYAYLHQKMFKVCLLYICKLNQENITSRISTVSIEI